MENWEGIITLICSVIIATLISATTLIFEIRRHKQSSIIQAITENRIDWIVSVRNLISDFICAYIDGASSKELTKIMIKTQLFFRNKEDYNRVLLLMEKCCVTPYLSEPCYCQQLVAETQTLLHRVWIRIKIESGQSKELDNLVRKKVNNFAS